MAKRMELFTFTAEMHGSIPRFAGLTMIGETPFALSPAPRGIRQAHHIRPIILSLSKEG